jgi:hypothetical protein
MLWMALGAAYTTIALNLVQLYLNWKIKRGSEKAVLESGDAMCEFVGDGVCRNFQVPFDVRAPWTALDVYVDGERYIDGYRTFNGGIGNTTHLIGFNEPPKRGARITIVFIHRERTAV